MADNSYGLARWWRLLTFRGWLTDVAIIAGATAGAAYAMEWDRAITAVLVYLVGVVFVGARSGLRQGMLAALFASFIYNFFLSDPRFRFGVSTVEELVPLIAFNLAAFTSGGLAGRLQDAVKAARRAESRNELLLSISDELQRAVSVEDVISVARDSYTRLGLPIVSLMVRKEGELHRFEVAQPAFAHDEVPDEATRVELVGPNGAMGGVIFGDPARIRPDFRLIVTCSPETPPV